MDTARRPRDRACARKDCLDIINNDIHYIHDTASTLLSGGKCPATTFAPESTPTCALIAGLATHRAQNAWQASCLAAPLKKHKQGQGSTQVSQRLW